RAEFKPCGQCAACQWFIRGNHPDFRALYPAHLDEQQAEQEKAGQENGAGDKKSKAPSKEIRIEQIRALIEFANLGSHRRGLRIALLYPAGALNLPAANALLKILEEPPATMLFVLIAHQ